MSDIDLNKYKRKRTFNGSTRDNRTRCEIVSDKNTAIEYMTSFINDESTKDTVKHVLVDKVPSYFWINPSSSSGKYHPFDERGKFGLVLHTCRVVKITNDLCTAAQIEGIARDNLIAAAILHDTWKYGQFPGNYHTVKDHSNIPQQHINIPDRIIQLIRTHDGQWSVNPDEWQVADDHQKLLHYADYLASRAYIHIKIP